MSNARESGVVDALVLQHRCEVVISRPIHQAVPFQFGDRADAGAIRCQDDSSGVLKNHGEDDRVGSLSAIQQNAGRADAKVGTACRDRGTRIHAGTSLANFDLKAVLAIESLLDCGVVTRELELVLPF